MPLGIIRLSKKDLCQEQIIRLIEMARTACPRQSRMEITIVYNYLFLFIEIKFVANTQVEGLIIIFFWDGN